MKEDRIVIQKLKLDVYAEEADAPELVLDTVMEDLKGVLLPLLEQQLRGMFAGSDHLILDRLDLDVQVDAGEDWEAAVSAEVADQVQKAVAESVKVDSEAEKEFIAFSESGPRQVAANPRIVRAWVAFLQDGVLPWWTESLGVTCLADLIARTAKLPPQTIWASPEILQILHNSPVAAIRLVLQVPQELLHKHLEVLLGERLHFSALLTAASASLELWRQLLPAVLRALPELLGGGGSPIQSVSDPTLPDEAGLPLQKRQTDPAASYRLVTRHINSLPTLAAWQQLTFLPEALQPVWQESLAAVAAELTLAASPHAPGSIPDKSAPQTAGNSGFNPAVSEANLATDQEFGLADFTSFPDEALTAENYFSNTGLVLLHPFLPMLFRNLGLLDEDDDWAMPHGQVQAIHLLHFLATGEWEASEDALFLPKILTGFDRKAALPPLEGIDFAGKLEAECAGLLEIIQTNWRPMRACTWEGLAVDFLQRPGKLSQTPAGHWKLQIESSTVDVLLRFLGWGLSPVKYDWMDGFLMVEWT